MTFRPKPSHPRWKPYDRFHLRRRIARQSRSTGMWLNGIELIRAAPRRPFTVNWLTNYDISRALRSTNRRWRKVRR